MNSEIIVQRHPIIWEEKVKSFWCDIIIIGSHYEFDVTNHLHAENSTMEANISSFFINLFIEEKSNEFITIFFGVIPFNDKKIYIYLLMQVCLQIISMQIRSKKGRTISFQWCMEISTQRLLKHSTAQHSTAYLIHQHKSEWIPVLKGTNYTFRVLCLNFQPKKLYKICISKPWILF
jgi:hypothetical protein